MCQSKKKIVLFPPLYLAINNLLLLYSDSPLYPCASFNQMFSSIPLRVSSSFGFSIATSQFSHVPSCRDLCSMVTTSTSPTQVSACKTTGISSGCTCCENPLFTDGWRERSSYLCRLLVDFTLEQIGTTLFPKSVSLQPFQTLGDRKR